MDSLRLVEVADGGDLVLMTGDGRRFSLTVDDDLRAAVRRERSRDPVRGDARPGPREVQARVRSGDTAEEIADSTGLEVEYVRRFEGPILAEREHVAELARASVLDRAVAADVTLDSAALDVLGADGYTPDDISWDSRRIEGSRWEVRADYRTGTARAHAVWRFDLTTRTLEPRGPEAERISGREQQQRRLSAVRDRVFDVEQAATAAGATAGTGRAAGSAGGTIELLDALARQRGRRPLSTPLVRTPDPSPDPVAAPESDTADPDDAATEPAQAAGPGSKAAGTAASAPPASGPPSPEAELDAPAEPDLLSELDLDVPTYSPGTAPVPAPVPRGLVPPVADVSDRRARRRRTAVPSWDDIVFGTRRDED